MLQDQRVVAWLQGEGDLPRVTGREGLDFIERSAHGFLIEVVVRIFRFRQEREIACRSVRLDNDELVLLLTLVRDDELTDSAATVS